MDKVLLVTTLVMLVCGVLFSLAGSPVIAEKLGLDSFFFVKRHLMFASVAALVLLGISFLDTRQVRRVALVLLGISLIMVVATIFLGSNAKGATRWIRLFGISIQASELLKPAFVVITAWLFSEKIRDQQVPGNLLAIGLLLICIALLVLQPDFGQTLLISVVWGAMFFVAGMPWIWIIGFAGFAIAGLGTAYLTLHHVTARIDRFISGEGENFQAEKSLDAILNGGWLGQGPGEGVVKRHLPDSHTDFIFSVLAEEYGIVICLILVAIFAFIVLRGLFAASREKNTFVSLALTGLSLLIGLQASINMAVTLSLIPPKGMTLPMISYGGSSLISVAITMGFILALSRSRPERLRQNRVTIKPNGVASQAVS